MSAIHRFLNVQNIELLANAVSAIHATGGGYSYCLELYGVSYLRDVTVQHVREKLALLYFLLTITDNEE
jgi:hypothetical protein